MLTEAENVSITRVGPGTPCGDLMRRYWQPVALAEELDATQPMAVRVLGEDLVLFRDEHGAIGLMQRHCPHRGADLTYGRIEDGGLRCIYHGWLFGANGVCLERPGEPNKGGSKERVFGTSYRCREAGGIILAYMGPGEAPPLPSFPFFDEPDDDRIWCTKMLHECNWLQANEGNVDPQHLSFLHRFFEDRSAILPNVNRLVAGDVSPEIFVKQTNFGLRVLAVRDQADGGRYVRITNFIMPNCSSFEGVPVVNPSREKLEDNLGYQIHWHVPIDDTSHWKYTIVYRYCGKMDRDFQRKQHVNIDEKYDTPRNARNRFLQDRGEMAATTYAGFGQKYYDHDKFATESQGLIADRTVEHLGVTDKAIVAMRRQLFAAISDVANGRAPLASSGVNEPLADMIVWSGILPPETDLSDSWTPPSAEFSQRSPELT